MVCFFFGENMSRKTEIELTNMCLVYNETSILVQEKTGTKYEGGLVFPGGHIEEGESLASSSISFDASGSYSPSS